MTCNECQKPINNGEMTHIQHNPRKTYHWSCYQSFIARVIKLAQETKGKVRRYA